MSIAIQKGQMTMTQKKTAITFRLDEQLAKQFKELAESNNRNQSLLLRDFIIDYIKQNRQRQMKF